MSDRPRPLLLIFDRGSDFFPVLQHTSTYQVQARLDICSFKVFLFGANSTVHVFHYEGSHQRPAGLQAEPRDH